jgi:hypothetical protein
MKKMTKDDMVDGQCALGSTDLDAPPPEISAALKVLSGKWTLIILCQLAKRTARFNELKKAICSFKINKKFCIREKFLNIILIVVGIFVVGSQLVQRYFSGGEGGGGSEAGGDLWGELWGVCGVGGVSFYS